MQVSAQSWRSKVSRDVPTEQPGLRSRQIFELAKWFQHLKRIAVFALLE
jgi:hypothetical protein